MNFTPETFSVKAIGGTPIRLTSTDTGSCTRVDIKAYPGNTAPVYVGFSSEVTPGTVAATDGFHLSASEGVSYPIDNPSIIYVVSSGTGCAISVNLVP